MNVTKPWKDLFMLQSAEFIQKKLKKQYTTLHHDQADQKSFENCYPFLAYIEHGQLYFNQLINCPLSIKPVLLFYGLINLIKACLLIVDPSYPESTHVLAHGVSTRKRKKQNYEFFYDEVKVQKNGLFSHFSELMFHVKHLEGEKMVMGKLLKSIPELSSELYFFTNQHTFKEIRFKNHSKYFLPTSEMVDSFFVSEERLVDLLHTKDPALLLSRDPNYPTYLHIKDNIHTSTILKYNTLNQSYVLPISTDSYYDFPELILHYLLLYNLSMIARYETEWWNDLLKTTPNQDYPLIKSFIEVSEQKIPFLINCFLRETLLHN